MYNFQQIMNEISRSANPNQLLMQMSQRVPSLREAMNAVNGKTPKQIRDMAYSMAEERGMNLNALAQHLGIKLPE